MMWVQVLWLLLAAGNLWPALGQSVPTSPCPTIFWYEVDASGNWHGRLNIPAPAAGSSLKTVVELDIDADLRNNNVGTLNLLENENEVMRRISNGNRWPVQFYLSFPLSWPLPILRSITANDNIICISNASHTFLTKVTLQHLLYPTGGNTYEPLSRKNSFEYTVPNTKNGPVYGVRPRIDVSDYDPGHNGESVSSYTPCPGLFDYQQGSSGELYGRISVPNPYPILAVDITVEIYVTGDVPMITRGSLQPVNNLVEEWNRIRRGEKHFVQYKLEFPVFKTYAGTPPLPTVKSVIVNDRVLCSGETPRYSIVATLTYHHAIFSDRCTSSSLKCPYNIEKSALLNTITPPVYGPSHPVYETTIPAYTSSPPALKPTTEFYKHTSQVYGPPPTAAEPISQTNEPSPPPYQPPPETHETSSPKYETTSRIHKASTATYVPTSPTYKPSTPTYKSTSPTYRPSPSYHKTTQPEEVMVSPKYTDPNEKIHCGTQVIKNAPLIAHGEETFPGQWPWHAALYLYMRRDIKFRCGGSYVGARSVITAAHCVTLKGELLRAEDFMVYLGRYNLRHMKEEGLQYHDVRNIVVHPTYNGTYSIGDIAVLILATAVEVTALVRPVCLWGQDDGSPADIINQVGLVVGWGLDERDEPTETLMMVQMPVVSQQACIWSDPTYYSLFTSNGTFCAGYRNGSSVCNGDSGGGMVFPRKLSDGTEIWTLRGIVSHGRRRDSYSNFCDTKGYIVFTDVMHYLDWVNDIVI